MEDLLKQTVQAIPKPEESSSLVMFFSSASEAIESWGGNWAKRDRELRDFWKTEPFLASAISSIAMTRAALSWKLDGPPKIVDETQKMLNRSDFGNGWQSLAIKVAIDLLVSDNGAFVEILRKERDPDSPAIGLTHLPSAQCIRTGNPETPVIYTNSDGDVFKLKWFEVITFEDMPAPDPDSRGRQISFLTRVLNAAQIIKNIRTYQSEKVSGRFSKTIHLVGGVAQREIEAIQRKGQLDADNKGLTRFMPALILASLDPNAKVSHEEIELASLPENFDNDETLRWYIILIAMAAGGDFQDFAPLSGGNLGTASQSETLHRKSQRKGHQLWIKLWEHKLQYHRVIPEEVQFSFMQQDAAQAEQETEIAKLRAETRKIQIETAEITPEVARQMAVDSGDLKQEYLMMMGQEDITPSITIQDDESVSEELFNLEKSITNSRVPISVAHETAKWFCRLVEEHPLQTVSPIPESKLLVFKQSLRNFIKREMVIGTTEGWQDYILTKAAYESGIHPHALRLRLPDSYKVFVKNTFIVDSKGQVIFRVPFKEAKRIEQVNVAAIASGDYCYRCGKEHKAYVYMPRAGWLSTCEDHYNRGLKGKAEKQQSKYPQVIDDFNEQFIGIIDKFGYNKSKLLGLIVSTLFYVSDLNGNIDEDSIKEEVLNQQKLLELGLGPEAFTLGINRLYFKTK